MPTYSYYCLACDQDTSKFCKIERRDDQICRSCGNRLVRQIDKPGMVWSPTRNGGFSV